jgi:hypothetical protein
VVGHVELYVSSAKVVQGARHVFQIHRKAIAFNAVQESVQYGLSGTADILVNMKVHLIALTLVASLLASQATAQNAPAALRGKSVVASWTEVRLQRLGGIGEFTERSVSHTFSAYISSEGRVFAKRTVYSSGSGRRHGTGSRSSVGENSGGAQQAQIRGQSLIITERFISGGARMAKIDFDQGFSGCTANVILGRENGQGIAHGRSLVSGQALEIKSAKVTTTSCAVRSGNVFGE